MLCNIITSAQNPKIKEVVSLRERKNRKEKNLTIVEGACEVLHAIEAKAQIQSIFICPDTIEPSTRIEVEKKINKDKVSAYELSKDVFEKISFGSRNEGILALAQIRKLQFEEIKVKAKSIFLVIEGIEKPGNLGAILRTADAGGVDGVIVSSDKIDIQNPNVIRASLGAFFTVKVYESTSAEAIKFLKENKVKIASASPDAKTFHTEADLKAPLAFVLGSEHAGLTKDWIENSDLNVKIPMFGKVDSLNISTSAAILIFEAVRQNGKK